MREIKFRAWDKGENRWIDNMEFAIDPNSGKLLTASGDEMVWSNHSDYELMQYTGLKDKNGVEIYEGDAVKISDVITGSVGLKAGYMFDHLEIVIEWDNKNALWSFDWKNYKKYEDYFDEDDEYEAINFRNQVRQLVFDGASGEVIGNRFENPELINSEELL